MRKALCVALIVLPLGFGAWYLFNVAGWETIKVQDVRNAEEMSFTTDRHAVYGIHIEASGVIEGRAKVSLLLDDVPYRSAVISGAFRVVWRNDWYSDTAVIRYEPEAVHGGHLAVHCRFLRLE